MRKSTLSLSFFVALCQCTELFAQGTLNFANSGPGYLALVFGDDAISPLSGPAWAADLYWWPGVVTDSGLLSPLRQPTYFSEGGLFFGGTRTLPEPAGSVITAQVRVWDAASGPSWELAQTDYLLARIGESILFQVTLGDSLNPANLTGLNGHPWNVHRVIPEPSPAAFILIGSALLLIIKMRHRPERERRTRAGHAAPWAKAQNC